MNCRQGFKLGILLAASVPWVAALAQQGHDAMTQSGQVPPSATMSAGGTVSGTGSVGGSASVHGDPAGPPGAGDPTSAVGPPTIGEPPTGVEMRMPSIPFMPLSKGEAQAGAGAR